MTDTTNLADMAHREADRAQVLRMDEGFANSVQMDKDRDAEYRAAQSTDRTEVTHYPIDTPAQRTDISLRAQLGLSGAMIAYRNARDADGLRAAWASGRAALAPLCDAADRLEVARTLYKFHDSYDGGNEHHPRNYLPHAVAQGVAHYLVAGKPDNSQDWWPSWHADSHGGRITRLAWLAEQLLEAADSIAPMRTTFERAAVMVSCATCEGVGMVTRAGAHESGEDSVEQECETCHGTGCGDCASISEDDERGSRGER